ncbi:MAG: DUF362 domain-containing protein [Desulfovibrio sp.]|nr:DUF362 domain-containing protein [Desulfovibrio sp.]
MDRKVFSRRNLLKGATALAAAAIVAPAIKAQPAHAAQVDASAQKTPVIGSRKVSGPHAGSVAKVYFSPEISEASLIKLYELVNEGIVGKVAIKVHTGEQHGPNILPRDLVRALQAQIPNSAIVETNTLYEGDRYTTEKHRETLKVNGWTFCPVDILDEHGDANLPVQDGFRLKEVAVGKGLLDYDSMLVLTHFKGHAMGGFGGSMKNIAIGCASGQVGKRQVHGVADKMPASWQDWPGKEELMELMADSAKAVADHFGKRITYINVLRNLSVDCDCAGTTAQPPKLKDIGILASTDLLAIDQAACDLVFGQSGDDKHDLIERIESRHGLRQLSAMAEHKMGNPQYELIVVS